MKMISLLAILLYSFWIKPAQQNNNELIRLCTEFNQLNTAVRDRRIQQKDAQMRFQQIISSIGAAYHETNRDFYFPLEHYTAKEIGGENGSGFIIGKYNYFDGNAHSGHPAHDIFIVDRNQDCKDDRTGKKVNVLSASAGIVVAVEKSWNEGGLLRGGKYVWIFSPQNNSLFYYAHNDSLLVSVGQCVKAGQIIAKVGRTGMNAFKKRSPTHLHFMQLELNNNKLPVAVNPYKLLTSAKTK